LLQTPTTVQTDEPPEKMRARAERNGYKNGTKFGSLTSQIKYDPKVQPFLKTPCTADSYTDKMKSKGVSGTSGTLAQEVVNGYAAEHRGLILPTPRANVVNGCDLNNPKLAERNKSNLEEEVAKMVVGGLLPTPLAGEYRDAAITENNATKGITDNISRIVSRVALGINKDGSQMDGVSPSVVEDDGPTSRLSPLFTEEMMGFPLMWTALPFLSESGEPKPSKPTATPSSPK
jgi:hypothetical protein